MDDASSYISDALTGIAVQMSGIADALGNADALRETKHLEPSTVHQLKAVMPLRNVEKNRKFPIPLWPNVGNIDVLVRPDARVESVVAVELKWCHVDKLYEAIWDLFKMALLATTGAHSYLVTGATSAMWTSSVGAELLDDGIHTPIDLCRLRLPWGKKLRAWDDLLWGGHDRYPLAVPAEIRTKSVGRAKLAVADRSWELRAVRVEAVNGTMTPFDGGWPFPRPPDAVRPLIKKPAL